MATSRREFIKKTAMALAAMPLLSSPIGALADVTKNDRDMKKIIIIDGGPRKNMNTAAMLAKVAEGATQAGAEAKVVRLYDLAYKGCISCLACKIKGRASNVCKFKDALTPVLEEIAQADGLVLGSPIYFGDVTG